MKKNYALIVLLVLTTSLVFSQPTITYNGNASQIGDVYYFSNTEDQLDPGPSGANQTWNFSVINHYSCCIFSSIYSILDSYKEQNPFYRNFSYNFSYKFGKI